MTSTPLSSGVPEDRPEPAISMRGVVKRFGSLTAVNGLDLDVQPGIVLGLLGPNGAGKSTSMRMLTAQSLADEGRITILGHEVPKESKRARAAMGVVQQHDNLDEELTCKENLQMFAHLYRVPRREHPAAVERALNIARLADRADTKVRHLSGGMRRRLLIARGLVHRPSVVLMDEPTVGLDPQIRQELWGLIADLRGEGATVLMSTHYIEEAERLSDEVALMAKGRIVERGIPGELITHHAGKTVEEFLSGPEGIAAMEHKVHAAGFTTRRTGNTLSVLRAEDLPDAMRAELGEGMRRPSNLEDVFVTLTGEAIA